MIGERSAFGKHYHRDVLLRLFFLMSTLRAEHFSLLNVGRITALEVVPDSARFDTSAEGLLFTIRLSCGKDGSAAEKNKRSLARR